MTRSVEFRAIVESVEGPLLVVDTEGAITFCNDEVARLFGYAVEEFRALSLSDLIPEPLRTVHAIHVDRYHAQPRFRSIESGIVLVGRHRDGSAISLDISLGPLVLDEGSYVMVIVRPHIDSSE